MGGIFMRGKKIISAFLVLLILLVSAVSCAKTPHEVGEATNTAGFISADTETELKPPNHDVNYEGYDFRVLHWFVVGWESRLDKDIYAESATGDVLKDSVYERNLALAEKYNVTISLENKTFSDVPSIVKKFITSDDDAYDLVYARTVESPSLITAGYYIDFNELPHADLSMPWWDQRAVEDLSIGGKLYLCASAINLIDKDATAVITFNKELAENNTLPDMYYIVKDNKWTFDKMNSLYTTAASDIDGDGKMTLNDVWGFIGGRDVPTSFYNGAGARFAVKDTDDMPVYNFDNEYSYNVTDKIVAMMNNKDTFYNHHSGTGAAKATDDNEYRKLFENGHGLFFWTRLDDITTMRASDTEFGILPIPKYSEEQNRYYSLVSIHTAGLMAIPITASDLERTSIIIEEWAYLSQKMVQPVYIDKALKGKSIRDNESETMLDIIFENRIFDIGIVYNFGQFTGDYEIINESKKGASSLYASKLKSIDSDIQKFIEQIQEIHND